MKKTLLFFVCALGVLACKKEAFTAEESSGTGREVTISAQLPEDGKLNVTTDGKVTWTANDAIAVYNAAGAKFKFTVSDGAGTNYASFTCADFTGELGSVAVYPYDLAGTTVGTITIPAYLPLGTEPQPVMASKITPKDGNLDAGSVCFRHIMGMVEFSLQDIPAYACALKVWCNGAQLKGDFTFDTETIAPIIAPAEANNNDTYSIIFPYKTGYGAEVVTKFYAPLPVKNYGTDLKIRVLDGDGDVIENTGIAVPTDFSNISAGKYLAMPVINVRTTVGHARDKFTKVQKVKWAKSNLRAMSVDAGAPDKEGWQASWGLYDNPWETQIGIVYPATTCSGAQKDNISLNQAERFKKGGYYSHFDYFSWGTIGRAARVHNAKVTSSVAEFDITGKVFRGTATNGGDISKFTELTGDDRFADESKLNGDNSTMYGDLAFWASKGQYRMPTKSEITTLYTNSSQIVKGRANLQAGKYNYRLKGDTQDRVMNGILYTTVPFYVSGGLPTNNATAVELTAADIESGVFFPKNGERAKNEAGSYDATNIFAWNGWGVYWSGTYGGHNGSGYDDCARAIGWTNGNVTNYGYTLKPNGIVIWGNTAIGNCIRPVLYEEPTKTTE